MTRLHCTWTLTDEGLRAVWVPEPGEARLEDMQATALFKSPDAAVADCPVCGGTPALVGGLARLDHLRCRHCGLDFNDEHAA